MYVSVNWVSIVSDNGLSTVRPQAIIWNNAGMLLVQPPKNKLQWNPDHNSHIFIEENACEYTVWKKATILCRPQCVKIASQEIDF